MALGLLAWRRLVVGHNLPEPLVRLAMGEKVADPAALRWRDGRLWHDDQVIDLVYNRLTDFALDATVNADLRAVFEAGGVVLTPHPRAHALYADKRNLMLLSDTAALNGLGVAGETQRILLAGVMSGKASGQGRRSRR